MSERVYSPKYIPLRKLDKVCGVYQIRNIINGKLYIGSSKNLKSRFQTHQKNLRNNYHENQHLQRAYNKYGKDNIIFEVIEICAIENQYLCEQYWIDKFFGDNCYNLNPIASRPPSPKGNVEVYKKVSHALKEWHKDPENKKKYSETHKGHYVSEETRIKLSKANKGKKPSKQCIEGYKKYRLENPHLSEETKRKISEAGKGRIHTEESKVKMRTKVICVETQQIFNSVGDAGTFAGIHYTSISKCCKGHIKTAGGYHWQYI